MTKNIGNNIIIGLLALAVHVVYVKIPGVKEKPNDTKNLYKSLFL